MGGTRQPGDQIHVPLTNVSADELNKLTLDRSRFAQAMVRDAPAASECPSRSPSVNERSSACQSMVPCDGQVSDSERIWNLRQGRSAGFLPSHNRSESQWVIPFEKALLQAIGIVESLRPRLSPHSCRSPSIGRSPGWAPCHLGHPEIPPGLRVCGSPVMHGDKKWARGRSRERRYSPRRNFLEKSKSFHQAIRFPFHMLFRQRAVRVMPWRSRCN